MQLACPRSAPTRFQVTSQTPQYVIQYRLIFYQIQRLCCKQGIEIYWNFVGLLSQFDRIDPQFAARFSEMRKLFDKLFSYDNFFCENKKIYWSCGFSDSTPRFFKRIYNDYENVFRNILCVIRQFYREIQCASYFVLRKAA